MAHAPKPDPKPPAPPPEVMQSHVEAMGLDWTTLKAGIKRLLPIIKPIAALTPNKADDAVVALLESLLAE